SKRRLVEDIVREIKGIVDIGLILLDRGFESIEVYRLLNRMRKRWITPVRKNAKIMKIMDECAKNGIWGSVYRLQSNREYLDVKLVIYQTKDGDLVGFFTNINAEPEFIANVYTQRWGIETGYRIKKQFRTRTCSTNFTVRLFLFLVSTLIYNFWVSLNVENYILEEETLTVRDVKIMFRIVIQEDFT
ncbi:MAG: transposase, partial [Candidatus Aenigmatarchaeota archaeon]